MYLDPLAVGGRLNNELGNPAVACTAQMMEAISFTQLHLTKSQAPPFMMQLMGTKEKAASLVHSTEVQAARWLWDLWAANIGLFSSVVASILPLLVRFAREEDIVTYETLAMNLKSKSFIRLRHLLGQTATEPDPLIVAYHVKALFREACARGDLQAARCHAKMLEQLVSKLIQCNIDCRRVALWSDALPALLQMRRPMRDFSNKMAPILVQIWADADEVMPNADLINDGFPDGVISPILQEAFLHLRGALRITNLSLTGDESHRNRRSELLFQWLTTKAEYQICCLLGFYLDLVERVEVLERDSILSEGERYMEAALALALLHLYQKSFFVVGQTDGVDVHESAFAVHPLLKRFVRLAKISFSEPEESRYEDFYFWVIFVGTFTEERISHCRSRRFVNSGESDRDLTWFHDELVRLAAASGVICWSAAKELTDMFVWNESLVPSADVWFDQLVLG